MNGVEHQNKAFERFINKRIELAVQMGRLEFKTGRIMGNSVFNCLLRIGETAAAVSQPARNKLHTDMSHYTLLCINPLSDTQKVT